MCVSGGKESMFEVKCQVSAVFDDLGYSDICRFIVF